MSQNLYNAHRQWACRPPDERFSSLEALSGFLNSRRRASAEETRPLSRDKRWKVKKILERAA